MATKFNRQDAAISIALMNKTSKLLAAAVKLGKDNLIKDAIGDLRPRSGKSLMRPRN